jgi:outer membrane protein OmpA-like peptidoglycan-associated protein
LLGLVALTLAAFAQDATPTEKSGFDAHGFTLHADDGDLRDPLTVDRPGPWEQGDFWFTGLFEYADRPLVAIFRPENGDDAPVEQVVLDRLVALNVNAGVALHDYVRIDATAPVYFYSLGPIAGEYQAPSIGDVRAAATVAILRPAHVIGGGGPGFGVSGHVDLPTGDPTMFLGQPGVGGGFALSGTYEGPWYTFSADFGSQFNPKITLGNLTNSDQFVAGGAIGVLAGKRTGITTEAHLYAPFAASPVTGTAMPAEVLLSLRHQFDTGVTLTLGGAAGLSEGASAARYRAFLGFSYGLISPARAPDADAPAPVVLKDKCPDGPETKNGWKDDDGCPDDLGKFGVRVTWNDEDVEDAELKVRGPNGEKTFRSGERPSFAAVPGTTFQARAADRDRCLYGEASGVAGESASELVVKVQQWLESKADVEVVDMTGAPLPDPHVVWSSAVPSCVPGAAVPAPPGTNLVSTPIGPGHHHVAVDVPGYKPVEQDVDVPRGGVHLVVHLEQSRVVLEKTRIVILDKVFFEFNKAVIKPESFALLNDVAAVILAHPDVGRVRVEGHTDDKGNDAYNLKLSQQRADAVRSYLIGKGVPPDRLIGVGYGETVPIDTNLTELGRGNNRRVEFNLIDEIEPVPGEAGTPKPGGAP